MKIVAIAMLAVASALLATACDGSDDTGGESPPPADSAAEIAGPGSPVAEEADTVVPPRSASPRAAREPRFSDDELLQAAYEGAKIPSGVYPENLEQEIIYYLNTTSTLSAAPGGHTWVELCTDAVDQAREWALLTVRYSSVYRRLTEERETDKFFEFRFEDASSEPPWFLLARVHKCSYFEPTFDFLSAQHEFGEFSEIVLGTFHGLVAIDEVQEFAEYQWYARNHDIAGSRLLASQPSARPDSVAVDLYFTDLVMGDFGICDRVGLKKLTYRVDRGSGEVRLFQEEIRSIEGKCYSGE